MLKSLNVIVILFLKDILLRNITIFIHYYEIKKKKKLLFVFLLNLSKVYFFKDNIYKFKNLSKNFLKI